jgi:fatty acid desaturase
MTNFWYSIRESPQMWLILAGISGLLTLVGTIAFIAYGWSHILAKLYLYVGLAVVLVCLIMALLDWKERMEEAIQLAERQQNRSSTPPAE